MITIACSLLSALLVIPCHRYDDERTRRKGMGTPEGLTVLSQYLFAQRPVILSSRRPRHGLRVVRPRPAMISPNNNVANSDKAFGLRWDDVITQKASCLVDAKHQIAQDYGHLKLLEESKGSLLEVVDYLNEKQHDEIDRAVEVAFLAHYGQKRRSGEPYIIHPVRVAEILARGQMDTDTIISGLLHDTVEDTQLTFDDIELLFGKTVRLIVKGETEVSQVADQAQLTLDLSNPESKQAENLRSLFVSMADDWRIVIVKLADRLHNMRTLEHMPKEKQIKKAIETLDLYVPLAQRLGLWQYKTELSDLSFKYIYPQEDAKITEYIAKHTKRFDAAIDEFKQRLRKLVYEDSTLRRNMQSYTTYDVTNRTKDHFSIWLKTNRHNCTVDEINDLVAVRLVLHDSTSWLCYLLMSKLNSLWSPLGSTYKDYIKDPKRNGYQSLHTILNVSGQPIEVQIRTDEMHHVAENGAAAHWRYKDSSVSPVWIECSKSITELQKKAPNASEFVSLVRENFTSTSVFVKLRNGKIVEFQKGAIVQDVIEKLNVTTQRVLINGEIAECTRKLKNNDEIAIISSPLKDYPRGSSPPMLDTWTGILASLTETKDTNSWSICTECNPVPGDELIGSKYKAYSFLHRTGCYCRLLEKFKTRPSIYYDWKQQPFLNYIVEKHTKLHKFEAKFVAFGEDRSGLVADICSVMSDAKAPIKGIRPEVLQPDGDAAVEIKVEVLNKTHLYDLIDAVRQVKGVTCVNRGGIEELLHKSRIEFWRKCRPSSE